MAKIPNKWFADIWVRPNDTHCSGSPTAGERTCPGSRDTRYVIYLVQYLGRYLSFCFPISTTYTHLDLNMSSGEL